MRNATALTVTSTLVAAVLPGLAAQDRSPLFATVLDAAGAPIANATVTCEAVRDGLGATTKDIVVGTTDDRGRAHLDLLRGRHYEGWAISPPREGDLRAVSRLALLLTAGRVVDIAATLPARPRTFALRGADPWRDAGASFLRWFPVTLGSDHTDLGWPANDRVTLPPAPWTDGCLALCDADGEILVAVGIEPATGELPAFARPLTIDVVARDAVSGKPLAGAHITHFIDRRPGRWPLLLDPFYCALQTRTAGTTDRSGRARIHVPEPRDVGGRRGSLTLHALRPDCQPAHVRVSSSTTAEFSVRPGTPTRVVASGFDSRPRLEATVGVQLASSFTKARLACEPLGDASTTSPTWLVQPTPAGFMPLLSLQTDEPLAAVAPFVKGQPAEFRISRDDLDAAQIRVLDAIGNPAPAVLAITEQRQGLPVYWQTTIATDIAGRATVCVPAVNGPAPIAFVTTADACGLELIDLSSDEPTTVRLVPFGSMNIRAVAENGEPVSGARVRQIRAKYRGRPGNERDAQLDRVLQHLLLRHVSHHRTGSDGVVRIALPMPARLSGQFAITIGERQSATFDFAAGSKREVVVRN